MTVRHSVLLQKPAVFGLFLLVVLTFSELSSQIKFVRDFEV